MSKAQFANEPSMEEILSSIRKMISDDKPQRDPLADVARRSPFELSEAAQVDGFAPAAHGVFQQEEPQPQQSFNSLADALKAASALSDQRRSLETDVASILSPKPAREEVVTGLNRDMHRDFVARLPGFSEPRPDVAGGPARREPVAFDFDTLVPHRESGLAPIASEPAAAPVVSAKAPTPEPAAKTELPQAAVDASTAREPTPAAASQAAASNGSLTQIRQVPLGDAISVNGKHTPLPIEVGSLNGAGKNGISLQLDGANETALNGSVAKPAARNGATNGTAALNGSAVNGGSVAPFPRITRDTGREAPETARDDSAEKLREVKTGPADSIPAAQAEKVPTATLSVAPDSAQPAKAAAPAEALVDAVVELVQQQPGALSVFNSGASFISGVVAKATVSDGPAPVPAKLDRDAAELLRPMLRQWLADNMPRIVEEALRSELNAQTEGSKEPGKS